MQYSTSAPPIADSRLRGLTTISAWWRIVTTRLACTGAGWALAAAVLLALAAVVPWLSVPLIQTYHARDLPLRLGWGPQGGITNYAVLCLALALLFTVRALSAWLSDGWSGAYLPWRRPLAMRTCIVMALLSLAIPALYLYQFTLVDFSTVTRIVSQEDQASLIYSMLGYNLPHPILPLSAFHLNSATPADRFGVLVRCVFSSTPNLGLLLPLLTAAILALGAVRRRQYLVAEPAVSGIGQRTQYRVLLILAAGAGLLLMRAPAGLLCQWLGNQSVDSGNAHTALTWYGRATRLTPTLLASLSFHQTYGEAEFLVGNQHTVDVGMYLTQQYRDLGAVQQAVQEDQTLAQTYGTSAMLTTDTELSLEEYIFGQTEGSLIPYDNEQYVLNPNIAGNIYLNEAVLPSVNELLQVSPSNVYAYYLRGRILFAQHAYERSAQDFEAVLALTTDAETKSSAYTYLSFCAIGLGDYASGRTYLVEAEQLDSGYYNTTAREAASGLH